MIAFQNGEFIPISQLRISPLDKGLIHGAIVAERLRTFSQKIFLLDEHLQRFNRGLKLTQVKVDLTSEEIKSVLEELIELNSGEISRDAPDRNGSELAEFHICFFATPGVNKTLISSLDQDYGQNDALKSGSNFVAYVTPFLPSQYNSWYESGVAIGVSSYREVPQDCWPLNVKIRSRLNYYLADTEAQNAGFDFPVILNQLGNVADSSIASIIAVDENEAIHFPIADQSYSSTSAEFLKNLCREKGLEICHSQFSPNELQQCQEVMLVSTPWSIIPVREIDGVRIGSGEFELAKKLLKLWRRSQMV